MRYNGGERDIEVKDPLFVETARLDVDPKACENSLVLVWCEEDEDCFIRDSQRAEVKQGSLNALLRNRMLNGRT